MKAKRHSKKKVLEEKNCKSPSVGFEPAMPGLKVQCYNHHSMRAIVKNRLAQAPESGVSAMCLRRQDTLTGI